MPSKTIDFALTPELASEVKQEAAHCGLSLKKLFEEIWEVCMAGQ